MATRDQDQITEDIDRKNSIRIALVSAIIAALAFGLAAWKIFGDFGPPPLVFVATPDGTPRTDLTLVGPDGAEVTPDNRGIAVVPRSWIGKIISVRDAESWEELTAVKLENGDGDLIRLRVP